MAFAISEGKVVELYKPAGGRLASVRFSDQTSMAYADIWKSQPQVRTVVSFLSRNIAQLGLHLYRRVSDVDRERVTDHPVAELLNRPNAYTTQYRLIEALVADCAVFDNAYLLKVKPKSDSSAGLIRVDPASVEIKGDTPFVAERYKIGKTEFKPEDIIHFRGYSPIDARQGVSPMETLRVLLSEDYQASKYREQLWRNGARTAGYLERPAGAPQWTAEGKEKFRRSWQNQYTGEGTRPGGTPILEDGMRYVPAATSARDAQYVESRKLTREEVTAAYHIPPTMVGLLDHATYSNVSQQHKMLYQDTLGPWLNMIQQDLALQLLPDFGDTEGLYLEFNVAEKLRGSFEEQSTQLQTAVGGPYMTRNEARARLNLPQIDDGDELIVPLNVLTGGQASPTDSAPPETDQPNNTVPLRAVQGGAEDGRSQAQ
jgi:HK97 family phage portal protein